MDPEFSAWVDEIGEGSEGPQVHLPSRFLTKLFDPEDAIHFLFPPSLLHDYQSLAKRSFLTPLNIHVDAFNTRMLELINGNVRTYHSFDSVKEDELSAGSAHSGLRRDSRRTAAAGSSRANSIQEFMKTRKHALQTLGWLSGSNCAMNRVWR